MISGTTEGADASRRQLGARLAVAATRDAGVEPAFALAGTDLTTDGVLASRVSVSAADEKTIAANITRALDGPVRAGILVGSRMTIGDLGIWGYALITSSTCGEAVSLAVRFASLSPTQFTPAQGIADGHATVTLRDEHISPDTRDFYAARDLAALPLLLRTGGLHEAGITIETRFRTTDGRQLREALAPTPVVTGATHHRVRFPVANLDLPLPTADPVTRAACLRECERLTHLQSDRPAVAAVVRSRLANAPDAMPTIDGLAEELHLSTRTLRRHLTDEGTSYRAIRDDVSRALAIELLGTVGLTVAEVAQRLGYSDAAAFSHAFRRWTGHPAGSFRRSKHGSSR